MNEFYKGMWAWMMEHPFWGFLAMVFAILGITAIVLRLLSMISGRKTTVTTTYIPMTDVDVNRVAARVVLAITATQAQAQARTQAPRPQPAPSPQRPQPAPRAQRHRVKTTDTEATPEEPQTTRWDRLRLDE